MSILQSEITLAGDEIERPIKTQHAFEHQVWRYLLHGVVIGACIIGIFFFHEFGHAAAVLLLGGRVLALNVLGIQWYPSLRGTPEFGFGGYVAWLIAPNPLFTHLVVIAGSTGTLLIAFCAGILLNLFQTSGGLRTALIVLSLYFVDSVIHIIPVIGVTSNSAPPPVRSFAETYYSLLDLGVPGLYYITAVFVSMAVLMGLVAFGTRCSR